MAERETVVDKLRFTYEGLFDIKELYKLVDTFFEDRNYDKRELKNVEIVKETGKFIDIEIEPWKKYTDYYRNIIRMRMIFSELKEVEIEKNKTKFKINQGTVKFIFDAYIETDYEHRWESKPIFYFLRTVWDKFIYRPFTMGYQASVKNDLNALVAQIKSFLNVYKA